MRFVYKARNQDGALISGELDAINAMIVKDALADKNLFPVSVQPKGFDLSLASFFVRKVKTKDLVNLTRQIQVMFAAGTPMDRIIDVSRRQAKHAGLKKSLEKIHQDISVGAKLSEAFAKHPQHFNSLYINMLNVGETGGVLDGTLKEMVKILQSEHAIRAKVKSATLYPKIVMGTLFAVSTVMLMFVVPAFGVFYAKFDAQLPLATRILVAISDVVTAYWYLVFFGMLGGFFAWKAFVTTPVGKNFSSLLKFKTPIFGHLNLMVANARFGHLISALYRAGLPLTKSLDVVADTIDNHRFADDVRLLKKGLEEGRSLSAAMKSARYFTPLVIESTEVGELTGRLDELLSSAALFYDDEANDILKNLSTLIEPVLLFIIFGMIALLALAIFMPIWNLSNVVMPSGR